MTNKQQPCTTFQNVISTRGEKNAIYTSHILCLAGTDPDRQPWGLRALKKAKNGFFGF